MAAARGVSIGIAFQKRLGVGFFGGQGFIMERLEGDGVVFVNTGGSTYERTLAPGEVLKAEAGSIVAMQPSVDFDIEYVGSVKSVLFGGQGIFFATLRGPGRIWLQSLTLDKLIARVASQVSARTLAVATATAAGAAAAPDRAKAGGGRSPAPRQPQGSTASRSGARAMKAASTRGSHAPLSVSRRRTSIAAACGIGDL